VLRLELPKAEEVKPKKIKINAAYQNVKSCVITFLNKGGIDGYDD
jgi:hypothetical protein